MSAGTTAKETEKPQPLFPKLQDEVEEEQGVTEIESLCLNCHEQGTTRLLLTKVPHFKEIIVSSFNCEECGLQNNDVQFGGTFQEKGIQYTLEVKNIEDLDRQVVKSEFGIFKIPEIEFELEHNKKGEINTIEGFLMSVKEGLESFQPVRRIQAPEQAAKIDDFLRRLDELCQLKSNFHFVLEDPSGNSFLENPYAPKKDESLVVKNFIRTRNHNVLLGLVDPDADDEEDEVEVKNEDISREVNVFTTPCSSCGVPCETKVKLVDIPFFKETVIMGTHCDNCGFRDSEVKGGAGIEPKGRKISLKLTDASDLTRDILKSDTCSVTIPELEMELIEGTLGGKFTTIEGLLTNIKDQLSEKNPFMGDSAGDDTRQKMDKLCKELEKISKGEVLNVTIILDDPAGNSYLQNVYAPDDDPEMTVTDYERNYDQNELLGLNDMKTENYENDS